MFESYEAALLVLCTEYTITNAILFYKYTNTGLCTTLAFTCRYSQCQDVSAKNVEAV